jgi:L-rhamnose isomerase
MPFGEVWDSCCEQAGIPGEADWIQEAETYEKKVLIKRI